MTNYGSNGKLRGQKGSLHNGGVQANATKGPGSDTFELFNIDTDPNEQTDLTGGHPEIATILRTRLAKLRDEAAPANIPPNNPPPGFVAPKVWGEPSG